MIVKIVEITTRRPMEVLHGNLFEVYPENINLILAFIINIISQCWSEPLLVTHTTLLEISYRGSYIDFHAAL